MRTFGKKPLVWIAAFLAGATGSSYAQCLSGQVDPAQTPWGHGAAFDAAGRDVVCADSNRDAYFLERTPGGWVETARHDLGAVQIPGLGPSAAIDGSTAVFGNPDVGAANGAATVFEKGAAGWAAVATLSPSLTVGYDEFGWAVDVDRNTIAVGEPHLLAADGQSAVTVFRRAASTWVEVTRLLPSDQMAGVGFGFGMSVALDDDTLVVGARYAPGGGAAYVFERSGTQWTEVQKLLAFDAAAGDEFGASVDVCADSILVGAPAATPGAAYAYRRTPTGFVLARKLLSTGLGPASGFGSAVKLDGDRALVGAPRNGSQRGVCKLFGRLGATWIELDTVLPPTQQVGQYFGGGLSFAGDFALLGAPGFDLAPGRGALYEFALRSAQVQTACLPTPNSTGLSAGILQFGCPGVQAAELTLAAGPLPAHAPTVFFFGAPAAQQPFHDGVLCTNPPLYRLPPRLANANGVVQLTVDFGAAPAQLLSPGTSWTFQGLYRDAAGGPAGVNLTDAVRITFQP